MIVAVTAVENFVVTAVAAAIDQFHTQGVASLVRGRGIVSLGENSRKAFLLCDWLGNLRDKT